MIVVGSGANNDSLKLSFERKNFSEWEQKLFHHIYEITLEQNYNTYRNDNDIEVQKLTRIKVQLSAELMTSFVAIIQWVTLTLKQSTRYDVPVYLFFRHCAIFHHASNGDFIKPDSVSANYSATHHVVIEVLCW